MTATTPTPPAPPAAHPPPLPPAQVPSQSQALRRLYLTLFLRGRGARGLQRRTAPTSVTRKLATTLFVYALVGATALAFLHQPLFTFAVQLHCMTFVFLGMFVAASAGEVLFNKDEPDILLHRPIAPATLLFAKVRVLVEVSLYLAAALNLIGLFAGLFMRDAGWPFPLAHALSVTLESLFVTAAVVLVYQLCLRFLGRERLDGLMTAAQVVFTIVAVLSAQILPQLIGRNPAGAAHLSDHPGWLALLPPAWFASLDLALTGHTAPAPLLLAALAVAATALTLYLAFGKLAAAYESGLQSLSETASSPKRSANRPNRRRFLDTLVSAPPLKWWLRDPVDRAAFLLAAAYLFRDRDTKLRVYPGLAPFLAMPLLFLFQGRSAHHGEPATAAGFGIGFTAAYIGLIPMLAISLLRFSQHYLAADVFRTAPLPGPAPLCHGARRAVLLLLTLPTVLFFTLLIACAHRDPAQLLLLLPGLIALPVFALIPHLNGHAVPLSEPVEESNATRRGLTMLLVILIAMAVSALAALARSAGYLPHFLLAETLLAATLYLLLRRNITRAPWPPVE